MENNNDLGQLIKRTDAMEKQTSFDYNQFGQLTKIDYPNDPDVTFTYNSIGQRTGMTDSTGTTNWNYNSQGLPSTETDPFGDAVSYQYDALGRKTDLTLNSSLITGYSYDPLSRINKITTANNNEYDYSYHYLTQQVEAIKRNNQEVVGKTYDILNRLTSLTNKHLNSDIISKYDYALNNADLRTKEDLSTNETNSTKEFGYNLVNELISAKKYTVDNGIKTFDPEYKYSYNYDPMGNRVSANLIDEPLSYDSNNLNQYTQIFNPNGTADTLEYDPNGNLTSLPPDSAKLNNEDGSAESRTSYSYNDENRLSTVSSLQSKVCFVYDGLGRRRIKQVYSFSDNQWILQTETHYTYDQWNIIKETKLNSKLEILNSKLFFWGLDLSGTLQGAGGVGGLLELTINDQQTTNNYYPSYDANGNITAYIDNSNSVAFSCDYSPFGTVINSEGDAPCDYLFSTKPLDTETGLYYYGYRFYSSSLGRWLTRDPVGEMGGLNQYESFYNNPIDNIDYIGFSVLSWINGYGYTGIEAEAFDKIFNETTWDRVNGTLDFITGGNMD